MSVCNIPVCETYISQLRDIYISGCKRPSFGLRKTMFGEVRHICFRSGEWEVKSGKWFEGEWMGGKMAFPTSKTTKKTDKIFVFFPFMKFTK